MDRTLSELLRGFEARLRRRFAFLGVYLYKVESQVGDMLNLRSISNEPPLPDQLVIEKAHGLAGVRETCVKDSLVLVAFAGGVAEGAYVVAFVQTKPTKIEIGPDIEGLNILVGGGARPVAMGDAVGLVMPLLNALLMQIVTTIDPSATNVPLQTAWAAWQLGYAAADALGWQATRLATR